MRLGFIGTGRIGRPMVTRLVQAGHEVRALGRSPEKRAALAADGAHAVDSVDAVCEAAAAVLVCVYSDEQVREVCRNIEPPMLVVHTTGSPRTVEEIAARGIDVIDAPVSGGPHDIAAGRITLLVGGADETVTRIRPVLAAYGDPILHLGPLGAGQKVKLINNALFAAHIGLLAQAVRLAGQLGVTEETLLKALPHGSAASRALAGVTARSSVTAFTTAVKEFLGKDVAVARKVTAELGGDLGAIEAAINSLP